MIVSSKMANHRRRSGVSVLEVLVIVSILAILCGLIVAAVQRAHAGSERLQCLQNLNQIGLALHQHHNEHKVLPPGISVQGGEDSYPFMSWLTRILPYVDQSPIWDQAVAAYAQTLSFKKSPPHPSNIVVELYGCPSDPRIGAPSRFGPAFTSYLGVEGTNQFLQDGLLFLDSRIRFDTVTDGLSNTLMVGERPPSADQRLGWWYAGWGQDKDGSAEMLLGVQERTVGEWSQRCPSGPYTFGPGSFQNQCDAFHFWSPHGGGANFLFADGSARFLSYSAAPLMPAVATRSGGEVASIED